LIATITCIVVATVFALVAAVLHAGWNLSAKTAVDRFGMLWGQFVVAGLLGAVLLVFTGWPGWSALMFVALSSATHIPYTALLARGYDTGELSVVYPIGRGAGAAGAAVIGSVLLHDRLGVLAWVGLAAATVGIAALAERNVPRPVIWRALTLAATIAIYSVSDAAGSRRAATGPSYVAVSFIGTMTAVSMYGLAARRTASIRKVWTLQRRRMLLAGLAVIVTYGMVLLAFRRAPTGYVTILRESSVVIAVLAGQRVLREKVSVRRIASAATVFAGLLLVVLGRG
jgi:multidrug transporter EmrE-like cation transporter